jgi:hypothetical protein
MCTGADRSMAPAMTERAAFPVQRVSTSGCGRSSPPELVGFGGVSIGCTLLAGHRPAAPCGWALRPAGDFPSAY